MTEHFDRPGDTCPYCGKETDCTSPSTLEPSDPPEPGDVSVCFYCGGISLFAETGLRKPTDEERVDLLQDPEVVRAAGSILAYRMAA